jgi:hypothetical protein
MVVGTKVGNIVKFEDVLLDATALYAAHIIAKT